MPLRLDLHKTQREKKRLHYHIQLMPIEPSIAVALMPRDNKIESTTGSRGVFNNSGQQSRGFKQDWRNSSDAGIAVTVTALKRVAVATETTEKRILAVFCRFIEVKE